jgi:hypothetical protein
MTLVVLPIVIVISYFVVRIAAVALEISGLPRDISFFQAVSAFTGTGFTTREAEYIINHPVRRRVVIILMVLGNVGVVTLIASAVVAIGSPSDPWFYLTLAGLIVAVLLFFKLMSLRGLSDRLSNGLRRYMLRHGHFQAVPVEELLLQARGYGVTRCRLLEGHALVGIPLSHSGLRPRELMLLSVERGDAILPLLSKDLVFQARDLLVLYGRIEAAQELFGGTSDTMHRG